MLSPRFLLPIALLSLSGTAAAAGIGCDVTPDGYRCEAWPRGQHYRYSWATVGNMRVAATDTTESPSRRIDCVAGRYGAVTVTVIAPAGYVETATQTLRGCPAGGGMTANRTFLDARQTLVAHEGG